MDLNGLYGSLFSRYGKQGWWPLGGHYSGKEPDSPVERFEIALGAILTQNVAWKNVDRCLENLRAAGPAPHGLIDPTRLQTLGQEELSALIRSSGYHNQKAARILTLLGLLKSWNYDLAGLLGAEHPRGILLAHKGIGGETADSILLYALGVKTFVVDAYTRRILGRLGIADGELPYEQLRLVIEGGFSGGVPEYREFHALLVEHAKRYCAKSPKCAGCPLEGECPASVIS